MIQNDNDKKYVSDGNDKKENKRFICFTKIKIAKLSHPASIGWVALSSLVRSSFVRPSRIGDISIYLHYMMF